MAFTDYFLDTFIAPGLSKLGEPSMPDIEGASTLTLNEFILTSAFRANVNEPHRTHFVHFVRRADGAFEEYNAARDALADFVRSERDGRKLDVSSYFRALRYFEHSISQTYQGVMVVRTLIAHKLFDKSDGSLLDRLLTLYNVIKHADEKIASGELPTGAGSLPLWLTNEGVSSRNGEITYAELADAIGSLRRVASRISQEVSASADRPPN